MGRVGPAEPVGADPVVKAKSVEPDLEGTHVQGSVRSARILVCRRLREQRRRAVAAGLRQDLLGQLEHEVGRRFGGLVRQRRVGPLALEPAHLDVGQRRANHVGHFVQRWRTEIKIETSLSK